MLYLLINVKNYDNKKLSVFMLNMLMLGWELKINCGAIVYFFSLDFSDMTMLFIIIGVFSLAGTLMEICMGPHIQCKVYHIFSVYSVLFFVIRLLTLKENLIVFSMIPLLQIAYNLMLNKKELI
jgi:hypothetical protein